MEELKSWRTSSYSDNGGNCVEAAYSADAVLVRDTKDRDGAVMNFPAEAWKAFTAGLK